MTQELETLPRTFQAFVSADGNAIIIEGNQRRALTQLILARARGEGVGVTDTSDFDARPEIALSVKGVLLGYCDLEPPRHPFFGSQVREMNYYLLEDWEPCGELRDEMAAAERDLLQADPPIDRGNLAPYLEHGLDDLTTFPAPSRKRNKHRDPLVSSPMDEPNSSVKGPSCGDVFRLDEWRE